MQVLTVNYHEHRAKQLFCQSLRETGFGVITHHPIAPTLIEETYQAWVKFFNSPHKYDFQFQKPQQDGYFPFRTENAKHSTVSDLKEFFHFYSSGKQPEELKTITLNLFNELFLMAKIVLNWIEESLPNHIASKLSMPLSQMIEDSDNTLLRILHYPPLAEEVEMGAVRASAHEDINLITLLPAATAPGLQVLDKQGKWHAVSCDESSIVVNVGDMLQICTENYYQATTHRVVNPNDQENCSRYSMPFFLHPRSQVLLTETKTARVFLLERLQQIGIY